MWPPASNSNGPRRTRRPAAAASALDRGARRARAARGAESRRAANAAPGASPARRALRGRCPDRAAAWPLLAFAAGCVSEPAWQGPLPVRNQHPAQLLVMHMPPARTAVTPAERAVVRLDAAYSSLFLLGERPGRTWEMDGEYLRVAPGARLGLGGGLELAAEIPFAHTSGGFLDSFVIDYHDAFGLPDQGRDESPKDDFAIEATRNGARVWSVERDSLELLDVPIHATWRLAAPGRDRLGLAVRGGVELPTGDDERGYGSGEIDASLGLLGELELGGVAWYGHAQHTFAGTPSVARRGGLRFADVTAAGFAAEVPLFTDLSALVQIEWETSTLRELGLAAAARDQFLLWVGGRWQPRADLGVEVGFGEDLQGLASPDFTAWLGFVWTPGAARSVR